MTPAFTASPIDLRVLAYNCWPAANSFSAKRCSSALNIGVALRSKLVRVLANASKGDFLMTPRS